MAFSVMVPLEDDAQNTVFTVSLICVRLGSGVLLCFETGVNPVTGQTETAERRRLKVDPELPVREEYAGFIGNLLSFQN